MKAMTFLGGVLISILLAPKKEPRNDEILAMQPVPIRKACQDTCPDSFYRILRIVEHQKQKPFTYTVTFINIGPTTAWRKVGDDWIAELPQYQLELDAKGNIIEEQAHSISSSAVPGVVLAGYRKWNPKGLEGMTVAWGVGQERNKKRVFRVMIVFNQIDASGAAFLEDGTLIKEKSNPTPTQK
jgi:hypothetical protein